jgi:hypothetical protein
MRQYSERPQPVDYSLTYDDLNLYDEVFSFWCCRLDDGTVVRCRGTQSDDRYKEGRRWFRRLIRREGKEPNVIALAIWLFIFGGLMVSGKDSRIGGLAVLGGGGVLVIYAVVPVILIRRLRKRGSPNLQKYWRAREIYHQEQASADEAAREAERRKRSYWALLDGYEFEHATADVLRRHQFKATVTRGSADGGVDIEIERSGYRGVVQCKAHAGCVGPHIVRDLYGVLYHCGAHFGVIVSRGGFSKGATDFANGKPIFLVDTADLIAMQEGSDVLGSALLTSG